jgi:SAM-dependent methyltransferase
MSSPYKELVFPLNVYAHSLYLQEGQVDYLHYGLFQEEESVQSVQICAVQQRSSDLLLTHLPEPPCRILEVGLGLGTTAQQLLKGGYSLTAVTPSLHEINIAKQRLNDEAVLECVRFEDFVAPAESYDVVLLQESAQYILPAALFNKAQHLLIEGGIILIADEISLRRIPSDTSEHLPLLTETLRQAKVSGFRLTEQIDLSTRAAPTIDYLLWIIEKHREALLADLALTEIVLDDLLTEQRRYKERYSEGCFGYTLLSFIKGSGSSKKMAISTPYSSEDLGSPLSKKGGKGNFTFRPYQPGDEKAIQTGFAQVFPTYRTDEGWHWIYSHNPDGAYVMLAWADNGDLAAHYACTVHTAICAGRITKVGFIRDVFSTPRYRAFTEGRRGVFVQNFLAFLDFCTGQDKLVLLFGFPSKRPFRLGKLLMKYQAFSNWHYYRYTVPLQLSQHNPIGFIQIPKKFDAAIDKLWEKRAEKFSFAICRTASFLNWRFIDMPHKKYWIWTFSAFLSPDVLGYVVIAPNKPVAQLVDFCFPEDIQLAQSCWQQVINILRWRGVNMIETWFSAAVPESLQSVGFKAHPRPDMIIPVFRIFHPELDLQWTDAHFSYTMADSDLY